MLESQPSSDKQILVIPENFIGAKIKGQSGEYLVNEFISFEDNGLKFFATVIMLKHPCRLKLFPLNLVDDEKKQEEFLNYLNKLLLIGQSIFDYGIDKNFGAFVINYDQTGHAKLSDWVKKNFPTYPTRQQLISYYHNVINKLTVIGYTLKKAHAISLFHKELTSDYFFEDKLTFPIFGKIENLLNQKEIRQTNSYKEILNYISPEQLEGLLIDVRSNVYSLGIVTYQMLTGELPFIKNYNSVEELISKKLNELPISLLEVDKKISKEVREVILKALEKDPNHRQQTAEEFVDEVKRAFAKINPREFYIRKEQNLTSLAPKILVDLPVKFNLFFVDDGSKIDTLNKIYSRPYYNQQQIVNLLLTPEELRAIFSKMVEIKFFDYPDVFEPEGRGCWSSHRYYQFKVQFGVEKKKVESLSPTILTHVKAYLSAKIPLQPTIYTKELSWGDRLDTVTEEAEKLRELISYIKLIVESREDIKNLRHTPRR